MKKDMKGVLLITTRTLVMLLFVSDIRSYFRNIVAKRSRQIKSSGGVL